MQLQRLSNGQCITLTSQVGAGGEAQVYAVQHDPTLVAKIYHRPADIPLHKLEVMLAHPLSTSVPTSAALMVWPLDLLYSVGTSPRLCGFLMQRVLGMEPAVQVYNPVARLQQHPLFDYGRLYLTARHLAAAVHAVHTRGYVIGDVNTKNTLVGDDGRIILIDTDSFQVRDPQSGQIYRCPVGTAEYTPPELQGRDFRQVDRGPEHDRFGLAVLIFQLLMEGLHPFAGMVHGTGEAPPPAGRIAQGLFPYGPQAALLRRALTWVWRFGRPTLSATPSRHALPFAVLPATLRDLFLQCFADGHTHPQARPEALTWGQALDAARDALVTCPANAQHRFGPHLSACPWCEWTRLHKRDPFPAPEAVHRGIHLPPGTLARPGTPGSQAATPPPRPVPAPPPPLVRTPPRPVPTPPRPTPAPPSPPPRAVPPASLRPPIPASPPVSTVPQTLANSLGMAFVYIAAGPFQMGSDGPGAYPQEQPVHQVRLSQAFYLGSCPVTQGQWQAIMGSNPSQFTGDLQRPVETVSWHDAQEYIRRLNVREPGVVYRLPTEAEWEYAARAGMTTAYSYGDDPGQLRDYAWYAVNAGRQTHPVGEKRPNAWGLHDMHGHVCEWAQDWYSAYTAATAVDPTGPAAGAARVIRGGGWIGGAGPCRSAYRRGADPGLRRAYLGVRLLRTAP